MGVSDGRSLTAIACCRSFTFLRDAYIKGVVWPAAGRVRHCVESEMDTLYDFFFSEKFCFYRYVGSCRFSAREVVGTLWVWLITGADLLARAI